MCVHKTLPSFKPLSPQRRSACLTDVRQEVRKRCRGRGQRSAGRRAEVPRASVVSPQSRLLSLLLLVLVPGMINGPDEYCYSSVLPAGQRRAHTPWTHATSLLSLKLRRQFPVWKRGLVLPQPWRTAGSQACGDNGQPGFSVAQSTEQGQGVPWGRWPPAVGYLPSSRDPSAFLWLHLSAFKLCNF